MADLLGHGVTRDLQELTLLSDSCDFGRGVGLARASPSLIAIALSRLALDLPEKEAHSLLGHCESVRPGTGVFSIAAGAVSLIGLTMM